MKKNTLRANEKLQSQ